MVQWMVWKESAAVVALIATFAAAWPVSAQPSSGRPRRKHPHSQLR